MAQGIRESKLQEQEALLKRMDTLSNMASATAGQAPTGSYAKGILGGAASGASIGTSINAGWGTLIGAVVGAGAGAIGTGVGKKNAREEEEKNAGKYKLDNEIKEQQLKSLKQQYVTNQSSIDWMTKLRNRFKYK